MAKQKDKKKGKGKAKARAEVQAVIPAAPEGSAAP